MRKLITAALAAVSLFGVAASAVPASAEGQPYPYERRDERRDDRRDDREDRRDDRRDDYRNDGRRDYRWDGRDRRGEGWRQHVRRCERTYRSYNRRTDTYRTRSGYTRRCKL